MDDCRRTGGTSRPDEGTVPAAGDYRDALTRHSGGGHVFSNQKLIGSSMAASWSETPFALVEISDSAGR